MLIEHLSSLFLVAAAGVVLLGFLWLAVRNSLITVGLLAAAWVLTAALRDTVDLTVSVSEFRIFPLDALAALLTAVGLGRLMLHGIGTLGRSLVLFMAVLLALHTYRGVAEFGFQAGINDARSWLYFGAALVYAATVPGGWDRRVWKLLATTGIVLAAIAVPYFLNEGLGSATAVIYRDGELIASRAIVAAGALLVLQAAILVAALKWPSPRLAAGLCAVLLTVTLLLQHRTLWVAMAIVAICGFVWWSLRQPERRRATVFAATGVALLLAPVAIWGFTRNESLVESVNEAASGESTFAWRTTGWKELIDSRDTLDHIVTGGPAGADQSRLVQGQIIDVSAHNGFVDAYVRFGLPGTLFLLALGVLIWRRRAEIATRGGLPASAVGLLILTQAVFAIAYSLDAVQGLMLGVFISAMSPAAAREPAERTPSTVCSPDYAFG